MTNPSSDVLECPLCGKEPVRVSVGTASCDGMVDGKEVHNTIGMRPECWKARSPTIERLTAELAWQPIETGPKDGTEFLAYGDEIGWQVVDYDPSKRDPAWCWAVTDGVTYHGSAFTHWRPLPDPPARAALTLPQTNYERSQSV